MSKRNYGDNSQQSNISVSSKKPTNKQFLISNTDYKRQNTFGHSFLCCLLRLVLKTEESAGKSTEGPIPKTLGIRETKSSIITVVKMK